MTELEKPAFEVEAMGAGIGIGCNDARNKFWPGVDVRGVEVRAAVERVSFRISSRGLFKLTRMVETRVSH